jgi:hypothetical protein
MRRFTAVLGEGHRRGGARTSEYHEATLVLAAVP